MSLLVLVYSVVQTDTYAWISARTLGGLGLALLLGVAFAVSERRSEHQLLPPELLGRRLALRADLVIFLAAAGLLAMFFFQTLYLQRVLGFGPLRTGLSFLPFSGAPALASALMGRLPGDAQERDGGLASGLMTTAQQIGGAVGIAALITVATSHTTHALGAGARPVDALSHGFSAAFGVEVGILFAAALTALVLLRRGARLGRRAGVDRAVATSR
jgi:hypothetical protein